MVEFRVAVDAVDQCALLSSILFAIWADEGGEGVLWAGVLERGGAARRQASSEAGDVGCGVPVKTGGACR